MINCFIRDKNVKQFIIRDKNDELFPFHFYQFAGYSSTCHEEYVKVNQCHEESKRESQSQSHKE